jgi:hypothetical protein
MSVAAPPPTWIRTAKFLGLPLLAFALIQADESFPFLRFDSELANVLVGDASYLLPFVAAFFALIIPRSPLTKVIAVLMLLPLLCYSAVAGLLESFIASDTYRTGVNPGFEPVARANMDGYAVAIYRTNCGAPCSYGIYLLQEKRIEPGILLVRSLPNFYPADNATYQVIGKDTLLVQVPEYFDGQVRIPVRSRTYRLRPFVYFGGRATITGISESKVRPSALSKSDVRLLSTSAISANRVTSQVAILDTSAAFR